MTFNSPPERGVNTSAWRKADLKQEKGESFTWGLFLRVKGTSWNAKLWQEQSKVRMRRGKETTETIHHNIRPLSAITDWRPSATAKQLQQAYDLTRSTSIPSPFACTGAAYLFDHYRDCFKVCYLINGIKLDYSLVSQQFSEFCVLTNILNLLFNRYQSSLMS